MIKGFYNISFLLIICFSIFISNSFAQTSWELKTEQEGIKIYTRVQPDSKIKALKVECDVIANPSQLVALLMDVNSSAQWIYHTKSASIIKQISPSELYYYSEINMPWPTANRDFVAHLKVTQNPATKVITIDGPAVPGFIQPKKGIVRINNSIGKWILTPIGYNHVKIEYTLHVEPGGNIPVWMVNMFATEGPLHVFKSIKLQVDKPEYRNVNLPYIENSQYASN